MSNYMDNFRTYEDFEKTLLSNGFGYDDVEYYWRNPEEFNELMEQGEKEDNDDPDANYWDEINSLL